MRFFLLCAAAALVFAVSPNLSAAVIEDFEDVSDWATDVRPGALGGSLSTNTAAAQVGTAAGGFSYSNSDSQAFDVVDFTRDFGASRLDLTGGTVRLHFNAPLDPDVYIQLIFYDGGSGHIETDLPEGTGAWTVLEIPVDSFADFGSNPDLTDIKLVRFRVNGDGSAQATSDSFFVDHLEVVSAVPEPSMAAMALVGGLAFLRRR